MAEAGHHQVLLEGEMLAVLTRYLPLGMEGVGAAQARAVMEVVSRRSVAPGRQAVSGPTRDGLRMIRDIALGHRVVSVLGSGRGKFCGICRDGPHSTSNATWPCPIWASGILLGVVGSDDEDFEVGGDATLVDLAPNDMAPDSVDSSAWRRLLVRSRLSIRR